MKLGKIVFASALVIGAAVPPPLAGADELVETSELARAAQSLGYAFDTSTNTVKVAEEAESLDDQEVHFTPEDSTAPRHIDENDVQGRLINAQDPLAVNVVNDNGELLGTWEITRSIETDGTLVSASLRQEDGSLLVDAQSDTAEVDVQFFAARDRGQDSILEREAIIGVPGNYVYDPSRGRLHDYCSNSPDEFPNPFGANAPFHGPCALHDMCIEAAGHHDHACDGPLRDNMKNNCRATYGPGATRTSCEATAEVYYATVTAAAD